MQLKDEMLKDIVEQGGNIAQFASFAPDGKQRFLRIRGQAPNKKFPSVKKIVEAVLQTGAPYVNIRSFLPEKPDGNPFLMGREEFETPEKVSAKVRELIQQGFYVIINEEIDVNDGGFSGVLLGNVAEFATRDTPRCVEKPGFAVLPRLVMRNFARLIYGTMINVPYDRNYRVEFSVHPGPVGYAKQHQIIWQIEKTLRGQEIPEPKPHWPNLVSQDMGDKVYGLLMAQIYGFWVPYIKVVSRAIPPFEFGIETGSPETCWRRTCPREQQPGLFTTKHGMIDPWALMQREDPCCVLPRQHEDKNGKFKPDEYKRCEDPRHRMIASVSFQDDVEKTYSGAAITGGDGKLIVEGKQGRGDDFMIGQSAPVNLPDHVKDLVGNIWEKAYNVFGPVRFEWCYDKNGALWIVQLHVGQSASIGNIIYPGAPEHFEIFNTNKGIEALRLLVEDADKNQFGIVLKGSIAITCHMGDLLRRHKIPSRLERV